MSSPPWRASPKPSNSTESPSEAMTLSTEVPKDSGESIENGIVSCRIQSSSVAYTGSELLGGNIPFSISSRPYIDYINL
ncbi:hypothetical protein RSJ42_03715 [Methanosarcina hadiensis]|uniref:hypothetical protein n=1 Tax=Methanosarcina hadiensis TaxID=3078083 RepID=UPI00397778A1